jgi:hypothetical protein
MSVWERRDLPVLQALATSGDENLRHGFLSIESDGRNALGLDLSAGELHDAILDLGDAGYIDGDVQYSSGPSAQFTHLQVTGRGQQALGQWPLFDEITSPETLALLLERLAEEAPSDEEASNLRRAAEYARTVGAGSLRAVVIAVLSQLAKTGLGLG